MTDFTGSDGCTTSSAENWPVGTIGSRSRSTSIGIFAWMCGFTVIDEPGPLNSVWPSGGALDTISIAMFPEAPGRLSTSTG